MTAQVKEATALIPILVSVTLHTSESEVNQKGAICKAANVIFTSRLPQGTKGWLTFKVR